MNKLVLVTGGARSGKSNFAEELAKTLAADMNNEKTIAYVATAEIMDEEFNERIKKHQERRGTEFTTVEEPVTIADSINNVLNDHNVFMIECLTTWLGNIYYKHEENIKEKLSEELEKLFSVVSKDDDQKTSTDKQNELKNILLTKGCRKSTESLFNNSEDDKIFIAVTNETGMGVVPDNKMAREFRDDLGLLNKIVAQHADYVFQCVCGIPNRIK